MVLKSPKTAIVVYGRSQMGKSTWILKVLSDTEHYKPNVGDGDGKSCTTSAQAYQSSLGYHIIDLPGFDDSELRFEPEDIAMSASIELAKHGVNEIKIAVFESLVESTNQIQCALRNVELAFGKNILGSIIVVSTKKDRLQPAEIKKKLGVMNNKMKEHGIRGAPFPWQAMGLSDLEMQTQLKKLKRHIDTIPSVSIKQLDDLQSQIKRKAEELCRNQVPTKKDHKYKTSQVKQEKRQVLEKKQKAIWSTKQVEEERPAIVTEVVDYQDTVPDITYDEVEETESVPVVVKKKTKETREKLVDNPDYDSDAEAAKDMIAIATVGLSRVFSGLRKKTDKVIEQVEEEVEKEVIEMREKTKTRRIPRMSFKQVTKQRQEQRVVNKTQKVDKRVQDIVEVDEVVEKEVPIAHEVEKVDTVEVRLPVSHFIPKARAIVIQEATEKFKSKLATTGK